jgi:hypothetical protein
MYDPLRSLYVTFVAYRDPKTAVAIQKKIFVRLSQQHQRDEQPPVQIGVKFVARQYI